MSAVILDETTTAPERTVEQRMTSLEHANRVRLARAQLKREIRAGRRTAVSVLLEPPACASSMRTFDLLLAAPKVGQAKATALMAKAGISLTRTVGAITPRQRKALADEILNGRGVGYAGRLRPLPALGETHVLILRQMDKTGAPATSHAIADELFMDRVGMSQFLRGLEHRGFVSRRWDPELDRNVWGRTSRPWQ